MKETEKKIIDIIDTLRPYMINDGGNIEFVKFEDGIVYVKMMGACAGCPMMDVTLTEGLEYTLKEEVPEVKSVVNVD